MSSDGDRRNSRRTDELLRCGAKQISGQRALVPFVRWGDGYAYVEGRVVDLWEGAFGRVCRMHVAQVSDGLIAVSGKGSEAVEQPVSEGLEVNIGLNCAAMDRIDEKVRGSVIHVAFEDWGETREGNRFRAFRVLVLADGDDGHETSTTIREEQEELTL